LDEAAPAGHYEVVVALLDAGASINSLDRNGNTALHFTASQPHPNVVRLLLERGADQSIASHVGDVALHNAAFSGRYENVKVLLENGADVNANGPCDWYVIFSLLLYCLGKFVS
jgi:ankyrin repeat protein